MPRFHFHIEDGKAIQDVDGTDLPSMEDARKEAVKLAGSLLEDHADEFWATGEWKVTVTDADQLVLFTLIFAAIEAPAAAAPRRLM